MVAAVGVVLDESFDGVFEHARQLVVLEQDAVLQSLVPALIERMRLQRLETAQTVDGWPHDTEIAEKARVSG